MAVTLGQLIRERRMELNLTQEELAERVGDGVRQSEISRLERNRVTLPRRQRMEQLAEALDIPVGVLLARSGWIGAEQIDAGAPETMSAEPPGESHGIEQSALEPDVERERLPSLSHHSRDDHHLTQSPSLEESPHLHDAILRAEALIGESRTIYTEAQTTVMQARESLKRRRLDES